jgi:hypothetical protein
MKILTIHHAKIFRGYHYEIELENHGRFMSPPTITKNLGEYMRRNGIFTRYLERQGGHAIMG